MPNPIKVLIVDDERTARYGMRKALDLEVEVLEADRLSIAQQIFEEKRPEIVLLDLNLGSESGSEFLDFAQGQKPRPYVIVITAHGNERVAVDAMKRGAYHYIAKPFDVDELRLVVRNARESIILQRENQELRTRLDQVRGYGKIIGQSDTMGRVYSIIEKVAETDVTILISGESGVGKELVSHEIHRSGPRHQHEMVTVNCAAIPENLIESELFGHEKGAFTGATQRRIGKFEQARRGTLFLDEIGDMPLGTQAKILRALEERKVERLGSNQSIEVDVRIISATNRNLKEMVEDGTFRADLYYRLEVVRIDIPALRKRRDDIPVLTEFFINQFAEKHGRRAAGISPEALAQLVRYDFPGNVRQLRNLVERMVVLSAESQIEMSDLPEEVRLFDPATGQSASQLSLQPFLELPFKEARDSFERNFLLSKLAEHENNITHTAAAIGMHRQSLQQKIRDLDLKNLITRDESF
jgi:two-component system response regulator AtoC/two-component system nitrogen regulation response regulator NtrX